MLAETEALLLLAARAQHVAEVVRPALAAGRVVVCDRYVDSTLAYQGGGRGLPLAELRRLNHFATGGLMPDLRLLLDLPVEVGLARRLGGAGEVNRLDLADRAFHERVRAAYLELAAAEPAGWAVIDAARPAAAVAEDVAAAVRRLLPAAAVGAAEEP
jgi:dTMP kinase